VRELQRLTMHTIVRRLEWDAAHRVLRHESKCSTLHGHRYVAEIECTAAKLDPVGRVIDFGAVKEVVGAWIDENWDHTTLINQEDYALRSFCEREARDNKRKPFIFTGEPTAENIAKKLHAVASTLLENQGIEVVSVTVWETPNCRARFQL